MEPGTFTLTPKAYIPTQTVGAAEKPLDVRGAAATNASAAHPLDASTSAAAPSPFIPKDMTSDEAVSVKGKAGTVIIFTILGFATGVLVTGLIAVLLVLLGVLKS